MNKYMSPKERAVEEAEIKAKINADRKIVGMFLRICTSKLTINDMNSLDSKDIKRSIDDLRNNRISFDDIKSKTGDELYDYITGQGRLFE